MKEQDLEVQLAYKDEDILEFALKISKEACDKSRNNNFSQEAVSYNDWCLIVKSISAAKSRTEILNKLVQNINYRKQMLCDKLEEVKKEVLNDGIVIK